MKVSRGVTLGTVFIFLLAMMYVVINDSTTVLFASLGVTGANKKEDTIDISDIAYELDNRIELESISNIATNIERVEVYKGMTIEELGAKLNKSLKGILANKGQYIATKSLSLGVDPYMAVAIMLHETGCKWTCSKLARVNYNVGGMRGASGWQKFSSIEAGIDGFLNKSYCGPFVTNVIPSVISFCSVVDNAVLLFSIFTQHNNSWYFIAGIGVISVLILYLSKRKK